MLVSSVVSVLWCCVCQLRQSFDVEKELEAAGLLNAKQETHVNACAVRERCCQRNCVRAH